MEQPISLDGEDIQNEKDQPHGENDWIPQLGMVFETEEQAWQFWNRYAGKIGFSARKSYSHKSRTDSVVTSRVFVCSNQGQRQEKKGGNPKNPRAETRTGCKARLILKFIRESNHYRVSDFISNHNHLLQNPEACHMIRSQREVTELAQFEIDLADESGIRPKQAYELMGRQVGGQTNLSMTIIDYRNYLRDKRRRVLISGEAVAMLKYFNDRTLENPSFHHVEQVDEFQEVTNIVWADARMIADYARFGDVVAFDTTFGTNKEYRPFGVFVGFNHFRESVIFGATLLYDSTKESFEWVFKTFVEIHNQKAPKTIFTDQEAAIGGAIKNVLPETIHGLCTWHIMENATAHLLSYNRNEFNMLAKFSACMYEYEDEAEFEEAFNELKRNVKDDNEWLPKIYKKKEQWAFCYMKNVLSLGMRSTQLSESINSDIKYYLNSNLDIIRFFKNFERVVDDKRENEKKSEFDWRRTQPRMKVNVPILVQAGSIYTPKIFELFQKEYELSMAAEIKVVTNNEFMVATWSADHSSFSKKFHKVLWDHANTTIFCGCKKFERMGILCWHALKVLDAMNIKTLPEKYIWKRWTREAREGTIEDRNGRSVIEDTRLDMARRNRDLCRKFMKIASQASPDEEVSLFVNGVLERLEHQVEEKIQKKATTADISHQAPPVPNFVSDSQPHLKKKNGTKGSKRHRSGAEIVRKKIQKKATRKSTRKETCKDNLTPTLTQNSQFDDNASYLTLDSQLDSHWTHFSSFALPSPRFEIISTSQNMSTFAR
ncbi:Protein FAR1-RELATED SEQUENCE 5 [Rhynchospora pubera]|uniref:Protein FAR1-RELATED SEQUENCE 5 n=1 Tax=Rhynchospora pubera TaxID=906938 RepID=A0AAV8EEE2_9POAL|nr:Protein FAR1-RELATED SEQUENCE 5 [Rhynchospora pubera]